MGGEAFVDQVDWSLNITPKRTGAGLRAGLSEI